ncbi:tryptophanyl-tRNA synthetase [Rickenella mellea]|uniref:Tryptophan--tRNA ligase, mitochondrial n=1 Tax=Rickenella mellea TaxID=50990 RepID=A0A4Y7PUG3_9AGAM|nr:tryptophanyl-tRNA synthetase [Rickenella mellea]
MTSRTLLKAASITRTSTRLKAHEARPWCPVRAERRYNSSATQCGTVFSGIQPTGIPHLGNYLGAFSNWVKLQNDASSQSQLIFSIVGWHALTLPQNPKELLHSRHDMLAALISVGLDPSKVIIFHQDQNPDHVELAWILSCITPIGKLRRMTTWKARLAASRNANAESEVDESMLNTGLFTYPILQAADILAYRANLVPVGEDQQQHLELSRDIADTFNRTYHTDLFPLPQHIITPSKRILSLKDPTSKMSKSAVDVQSRILLTDEYPQIRSKIRAAVTDSIAGITYDPAGRPGTSNLLTILAGCTDTNVSDVAKRYETKGHGQLKADVVEAVEELLKAPRTEFNKLRGETKYLASVSESGLGKARSISQRTLAEVRRLIGLSRMP